MPAQDVPRRTPLTRDQLQMSNALSPPDQRPSSVLLEIYDAGQDVWRPALLCYPIKGSHAVLHTAEDYPRARKTKTEDGVRRQVKPRSQAWWDAPPTVRRMIDKARAGFYDEEAQYAGYESPISYVLGLLESFADQQGRSIVPQLRGLRKDLTVGEVSNE